MPWGLCLFTGLVKFCHGSYALSVSGCDRFLVFSLVRVSAVGAILISIGHHGKCTSAVLSKCIERAVAEKAVEVFGICTLMAGEKLAFLV